MILRTVKFEGVTNQEIIDRYMSEFHEVQRMRVPIEFHSYIHRMLNDARRDAILEAKSKGFFKRYL